MKPTTQNQRALIGNHALILAESVRATDDLARGYGEELLGLPELAIVARVIGAATIGRELPAADLDQLQQLFVRASESGYVTFAGAKWRMVMQRLLVSPDSDIATPSTIAGELPPVAPSTPAPVTLPVPDLSQVRHRTRPIKTAGPIPQEPSAPQPASAPVGAPRPAQVRHRVRPATLGAEKPSGSSDAC